MGEVKIEVKTKKHHYTTLQKVMRWLKNHTKKVKKEIKK